MHSVKGMTVQLSHLGLLLVCSLTMANVQCAYNCASEEVCYLQIKLVLLDLTPVLNYYFYNIPRIMRYAACNGGGRRM